MTPQELKNSILQLAIQGKLVEQRPDEGTGAELYQQIQAEKQRLIKAGTIKKDKPLPEISEDENPFDIPESWKWVKLGDVVSVIGGKRIPAGRTLATEDTGHKYIRVSDMKNGSVLLDNLMYVPKDIYPTISRYIINKGDVYITVAGTIGKVGKIPNDLDGANLTENADRLVLSILDQDWLIKCMESSVVQTQIAEVTTKVGQPKLAIRRIQDMIIPLPPLAEQKRIVAKIEELLPYIDRYEESWRKLEDFNKRFPTDMQKSILQTAIQGKLVDQRPEEGTGEELYQQIQVEKQRLIKAGTIKTEKPLPEISEDEKPFDIPESWKWVRIGHTCINIQYGTSQKASRAGKMPVLRMGNIQNGMIKYDSLVYTSDDSDILKYCLLCNDLLFNRTNSKELVGKTAIYKGEIPAIYAGYLIRITPLMIHSNYLNYIMQSRYYWSFCQKVRSDAIGQSNINAEKLKSFIFPLPPLSEQKRIAEKLEVIFPLCKRLKR